MNLIVMEGVPEYFSKEQVKTCLNMLCDSFAHGYLIAELHPPFLEKHSKQHDAVKHTTPHSAGAQSPARNIWRLSLE